MELEELKGGEYYHDVLEYARLRDRCIGRNESRGNEDKVII